MQVALEIVLPLFLMMVAGYVVRRIGLISEDAVRQTNKLVFRLFLPLLVLRNVYTTGLSESFDGRLAIFAVAAVMVEFSLALIIVFLTERENSRRGVMLQGMFRSNFVLFGIPVCTALFGAEASGKASILIAIIIPLFNVLAVIALEMFRGERPNLWHTLKGIVTNPLILASALGVLCLVFGVEVPHVLDVAISNLGGIATPLAFVILGASFGFREIGDRLRDLSITLGVKLLLFPALFLSIAVFLGFRGAELAILLTVFASPVAVSSFTMAQQMGGDAELAGDIVVLTSVLCSLTMFLYSLLFLRLGMY